MNTTTGGIYPKSIRAVRNGRPFLKCVFDDFISDYDIILTEFDRICQKPQK